MKAIGTKWTDLAIHMEFDMDGTVVGTIQANNPYNVDGCVMEVFVRYLRSEGRSSPSWIHLIQCLKDCRLVYLAEEIEAILQERNM